MALLSDLVHLSRLETTFLPDYTQHSSAVPDNRSRRKVRKLEKWKRERHLGNGSFGSVWLEKCISGDAEGKLRAVKMIQRHSDIDYKRELEAIALFSHSKFEQCFVKSPGWFENDHTIFIAMEYLPRGDLQAHLQKPIPESEAALITSQIVEGLDFMHERHFAHRDLKPANLLVVQEGPDWWIKISDFGISKRASEGETALRTALGTPAFVAPEVLGLIIGDEAEETYSPAVDIWSVGGITFYLLTHELPFRDSRQMGQYVVGRVQLPLDKLRANLVSESGCQLLSNMLQPVAERRPSAKELLRHIWFSALPLYLESEVSEISSHQLDIDAAATPGFECSARWSTANEQTRAANSYSSEAQKSQPNDTNTIQQKSSMPSDEASQLNLVFTKTSQTKVRLLDTYPYPKMQVYKMEFSSSGQILVIQGREIHVRNLVSKDLEAVFAFPRAIRCFALAPHTTEVAYGCTDGSICIGNYGDQTFRQLPVSDGISYNYQVSHLAFSADGHELVSSAGHEDLRVWNTSKSRLKYDWSIPNEVAGLCFSPARGFLALGLDGYDWEDRTILNVWDLSNTQHRAKLGMGVYVDDIPTVRFSSNVEFFMCASQDKTLTIHQIWESAKPIIFQRSEIFSSFDLSSDGRYLASSHQDTDIILWDVQTTKPVFEFKAGDEMVDCLKFSPNGDLLASTSLDGTIKLWDVSEITRSG